MFAVKENRAIFVVQNSANHAGKHTTYLAANKAGSLSDNLTPVRLHCSAKQPRGLASFVYNRNFFPKMQNSEKVSGTANNSTRTAPIAPYSVLKSEEKPYNVTVFGYVFSGGQGFGHCIRYNVTARSGASAITKATKLYERRPNALDVYEARIMRPANCTCHSQCSSDER